MKREICWWLQLHFYDTLSFFNSMSREQTRCFPRLILFQISLWSISCYFQIAQLNFWNYKIMKNVLAFRNSKMLLPLGWQQWFQNTGNSKFKRQILQLNLQLIWTQKLRFIFPDHLLPEAARKPGIIFLNY